MTAEEIQKLRDEATALRAAAKAAETEAAANPDDDAKAAAAEAADEKAKVAEAALNAAEAGEDPGAGSNPGTAGAGTPGSPPTGSSGAVPPVKGGTAPPVTGPDTNSSVLPLPSWWSFLLIGLLMFIVLLVVSQAAKYYFQWRAGIITEAFMLAPPAPAKDGIATPRASDIAREVPKECKTVKDVDIANQLLRQRAQAVEFGDSHRWAAIEFGSYFFANVAILGVFGLISLLAVAVIAKTGLDKANGHVVAVFLIATGTGILYQGFFGVFQQKTNIEANQDRSVLYANIVSKIDTYCATGKVARTRLDPDPYLAYLAKVAAVQLAKPTPAPSPVKGVPAKPAEEEKPPVEPEAFFAGIDPATFAVYIDWNLETLRKYSVAFDDKLVPSLTDPNRLSINKF